MFLNFDPILIKDKKNGFKWPQKWGSRRFVFLNVDAFKRF